MVRAIHHNTIAQWLLFGEHFIDTKCFFTTLCVNILPHDAFSNVAKHFYSHLYGDVILMKLLVRSVTNWKFREKMIFQFQWLLFWNASGIVNTLRPRQYSRHFPDDIFIYIFLHENLYTSIKFSLKFVPNGPINNIPALVQIMAWRRQGDKPLSEPMMI